jgi:hypothetical protein
LRGQPSAVAAVYALVWLLGVVAALALRLVSGWGSVMALAGGALLAAAALAGARSHASLKAAVEADETAGGAADAYRRLDLSYQLWRYALAAFWIGASLTASALLGYGFPGSILSLCAVGAGVALTSFIALLAAGVFQLPPRRSPATSSLCWLAPVSPKTSPIWRSIWFLPWFVHSRSARFAASLAADAGPDGGSWQPRLMALRSTGDAPAPAAASPLVTYPLGLRESARPQALAEAGWSALAAVPLAAPPAIMILILLLLLGEVEAPQRPDLARLRDSPPGNSGGGHSPGQAGPGQSGGGQATLDDGAGASINLGKTANAGGQAGGGKGQGGDNGAGGVPETGGGEAHASGAVDRLGEGDKVLYLKLDQAALDGPQARPKGPDRESGQSDPAYPDASAAEAPGAPTVEKRDPRPAKPLQPLPGWIARQINR